MLAECDVRVQHHARRVQRVPDLARASHQRLRDQQKPSVTMEILSRILVTGWLRTTLIPTQAGWTLASLLFFGWPSGSSKAPDLRSLKSLRSVDRPEESIIFTD